MNLPAEQDLRYVSLLAAANASTKVGSLTHSYYRYPARFGETFVREAVLNFSSPGDTVLDPFCGGGTTLVEALSLGRNAIGSDLSELAIGIARCKTTPLSEAQLTASISFEVLAPQERPSKTGNTTVPPFEVTAIDPSQEEAWGTAWPDDGDDQRRQEAHAYKADTRAGKTWVYYSTVFPPFAAAIERLKTSKPELVEHFRTAYEVWISYHAILQKQADELSSIDVDDDRIEELLDMQRAVVATMQVKQALQFSELWKRGLIDQHSA